MMPVDVAWQPPAPHAGLVGVMCVRTPRVCAAYGGEARKAQMQG